MAINDKTIVTKKKPAKPAATPETANTTAPKQAVSKKTAAKKTVTKKAPAATKVAVKKTPPAKKPAAKKAVAKKVGVASAAVQRPPSPTKSPAPLKQRPPAKKASGPITTEERDALIREAAYFRAEKRNFAPGFDAEDWAAAEREVDERLSRRS